MSGGDEKEFLTALVELDDVTTTVAPIPFDVELTQVKPLHCYQADQLPVDDDVASLYESDQDFEGKFCTLTHHEFIKWRKAALFVCAISIVVQAAVSVVAIEQGLAVDSSGTFGFGMEGLLDMLTTVIVIWRFVGPSGMKVSDGKREIKAVVILSVLMASFSIGITIKVIYQLTLETRPFKELKLMIISNVGFAAYAILAWVKIILGQRIQSKALIMDAYSTLAASGMALGLLFSLLVYHFSTMWFLDSIMAIIISTFLFAYSIRTLFKIFRARLKARR